MRKKVKRILLVITTLLIMDSVGYCQDQLLEQTIKSEGKAYQEVYVQEKDIIILSKFTDKTYQDMLKILGSPVDKTGYTIENAPTKSWNHAELFSKYPKNPENSDVQIMEVIWDLGDFRILACFHMVNGENRCLVAKKVKTEI